MSEMPALFWLFLPLAFFAGWLGGLPFRSSKTEECSPPLKGDYIKGLNYLLSDDTDNAIEIFVKMVDVDSETVDTHLLLGSLFRRRGEVNRAIRIHQNVIARPSLAAIQRSRALLELGRDYLSSGLLDRAEGLFEAVAQERLLRADAQKHLREIYVLEKDWLKAIEISQALVDSLGEEQNKLIAQFYCELAEQEFQHNHIKNAENYAKKAQARVQHCVRAELLLGDLAQRKGLLEQAREIYLKTFEMCVDTRPLALERLQAIQEAQQNLPEFARCLADLSEQFDDEWIMLYRLKTELRLAYLESPAAWLYDSEQLAGKKRLMSLLLQYPVLQSGYTAEQTLALIKRHLFTDKAETAAYRCQHCGFTGEHLHWQCPSCHRWETAKLIQ